ncbi:hypothetical protein ACHAQA_000138 [Verticillium albo-atrum]
MRVVWKPDVYGLGLLPDDVFAAYVNDYAAKSTCDLSDIGLAKLEGALDLLSHKNPGARVLELANPSVDLATSGLKLLESRSLLQRLWSWTTGVLDLNGRLCATEVDIKRGMVQPVVDHPLVGDTKFDVILLPVRHTADEYLTSSISEIKSHLSDGGVVLALSSPDRLKDLCTNGFVTTQADAGDNRSLTLARASDDSLGFSGYEDSSILVIDDDENKKASGFVLGLVSSLQKKTKAQVTILNFKDVNENTIPTGSTIYSLVELCRPVFAQATDDETLRLRIIMKNATQLNWVTSGNLLQGARPDFGLAAGMSRALIMEQPSLRFNLYDIDDISVYQERTFKNLSSLLKINGDLGDYEYIQSQGVVHVSRFIPDEQLNTGFRQRIGNQLLEMPLSEAKPVQLFIEKPGNLETLCYKQITQPLDIAPDHVQVSVKTYGLNANDYHVFSGKVSTQDDTSSIEFCGVVERVGSEVSRIKTGDRVVVLAPSHFGTTETVPQWACHKLLDEEPFDRMCTLPLVFATAIYGLRERAQLQAGESVLIHAATGGVGMAAIQVAQSIGAKVSDELNLPSQAYSLVADSYQIYVTVSTGDKARFLTDTFGIPNDRIFNSRDDTFVSDVLLATKGDGVDVVLNSLNGDLLHASWESGGVFGRFVDIGKRDLLDYGRLDMEGFMQNKTFTAFNIVDLYNSKNLAHRRKLASLISDTLEMYRKGAISLASPVEVFDADNAAAAFRHFSSYGRMGKVVLSLENKDLSVRVKLPKHSATMSREKTYILVGCLGGLGRSLSRWMVSRGVRKFVFLGRSGTDKPAAQALIEGLERSGVECTVVRGDVSIREDVDRALAAVKGNIATESNYCAGNYFLDLFARYRRSLGLPAAAIGLGMISEVGYLHENPDIEALLLRRGIHALNEEEMLHVVDAAISSVSSVPNAYDKLSMSHILTGLEPLGLRELNSKGFQVTNLAMDDPRAAILKFALQRQAITAPVQRDGQLPAGVAAAMEDGHHLADAILTHIMKKLGNLLLLPMEKIVATKALMEYGIDSMLAAEFRTWFYQELQVDIPFLELLGKTVTLKSLSETTVANILGRQET